MFPGNLQGRHAREVGPKGCTLVTVEDGAISHIEERHVDVLRWSVCRVDVNDVTTTNDVLDRVSRALTADADHVEGRALAARVEVTGRAACHDEISANTDHWIEEIRALAIGVSSADVWVERVRFATDRPIDLSALAARDDALGSFLRELTTAADSPDEMAALREALADVRNMLPSELLTGDDAVDPYSPDLLARLVVEARELLLARIAREGGDAMKILDLRLIAFGPFTGRVLDLSAGNHGLHVIFGPNEAGKSCALRALHALLYGIPAQTNDAFLHPYGELRVGARLRLSSGDEIEFSRRKANRGSLLGPGGVRLDDRALDRFLDGVGPDQFRMFWGIDYARLVEGGQEILKGQGDLGESLFAAGSGASHLGALRKKLDEEAVELFAPRGRNRVINQAVGYLRDLRSAQREATVSSEAWAGQDRAARDADTQVRQLAARVQELAREKSRLERLKRILPLLGRTRRNTSSP